MSLTFCDNSPIQEIAKNLEEKNKKENKKYGVIINCGGSPAIIADSWLTNDNPDEIIRESQKEDLNNMSFKDNDEITENNGLDKYDEAYEETNEEYNARLKSDRKPTEVIIMDFTNKTIEYNSDWII